MVLGLLLCAAAATPRFDEADRIRLECPNGAVVVAEAMPKAKTVSIQLVASSRGCPESPATHGWRHLLEHLIVGGADHQLGERVEMSGGYWGAETFRDFMILHWEGPPIAVASAFEAVREVLRPPTLTSEQVASEVGIVAQEAAIAEPPAELSIAAWQAAAGDSGLDPLGQQSSWEKATPNDLQALFRKQFAADGLTLSISGPVQASAIAKEAMGCLSKAPAATGIKWSKRAPLKSGIVTVNRGSAIFGEAPNFSSPTTAWYMVVGAAIALLSDDAQFLYTPSIQPGLVIVASPTEDLKPILDELKANPAPIFEIAKYVAKVTWTTNSADPKGRATVNGMFANLAFGGRRETVDENIEAMRVEDFARAVRTFGSESK